jgi:hypothetical protein
LSFGGTVSLVKRVTNGKDYKGFWSLPSSKTLEIIAEF